MQFDPKVYGVVQYHVRINSAALRKGGKNSKVADLKLWVNAKSSDSDSLFLSVNGGTFMSWHVNASDDYTWRKFWKNIVLVSGNHTITIGFKYPQMYVTQLWIGTGSFQPLEAELAGDDDSEDFEKEAGEEEEKAAEELGGNDLVDQIFNQGRCVR